MISRQAIRDIAAKLLAKTLAKQVKWLPHELNNSGCQLLLPRSALEVIFDSPAAEPDRVTITVNRIDDDGVFAHLAEFAAQEGDEDWELFLSLYDEASRVAYQWDQVLNDLQSAVNAAGPIGKDDE